MSTLAELLAAFDRADTTHRSAMAVGRAQSGLDGPMGMRQTQGWAGSDVNATRSARDAAIQALRGHFAGNRNKLAQLDVYVDLRHQPSAQIRKGARQQLIG